jgi:hypothetical protein
MAEVKTKRKNYNTRPDPAGVMYLRDLDPLTKRRFKAACVEIGISMTDAVAVFMGLVQSKDRYVLECLRRAKESMK